LRAWRQSGSYHYVLLHEGRRYPPKYILHRVTGAPLDRFCGGDSTNRVFRQLGFDVVRKAALEKRRPAL
jgi:5-methylcytosine-specific restriction protein B